MQDENDDDTRKVTREGGKVPYPIKVRAVQEMQQRQPRPSLHQGLGCPKGAFTHSLPGPPLWRRREGAATWTDRGCRGRCRDAKRSRQGR